MALRFALWKLSPQALRKTIALDEPTKHINGKNQLRKTASLMKEFSKRLGVQLIIVTCKEELLDEADKVFQVTKKNGMSSVVEM